MRLKLHLDLPTNSWHQHLQWCNKWLVKPHAVTPPLRQSLTNHSSMYLNKVSSTNSRVEETSTILEWRAAAPQDGPVAKVRGQEVQERGQAQEEDRAVQEEALVGQEASDGQAASEAQEVQEDPENQEDQDIQEFLEALVGQVVLEDREAELRHHPRRTARGPQWQAPAGHHEMQDWRMC